MPGWCEAAPAGDGPLRSLVVEGDQVSYRAGCHPQARLYFTDGGMNHTTPGSYQLLDLDSRQPFIPRPRSGR
jgi:hypothetical protein